MKKIILLLFFQTFIFANFLPRCDDPKIITLYRPTIKEFLYITL